MTTRTTQFGELFTQWKSHKHPDNPNFMQIVYWNVFEKDGKTTVCWHLGDPKNSRFIYGITKAEAIARFTDDQLPEISEDMFQEWLKNKI